jgi:NAD(P)-dependent dehydrogenase (short-subunit alcohol dehydrogenase family)
LEKGDSVSTLSEQSILVTGANSGLGYEAAAQLAEAGYGHVILACRTLEKAEEARRTLAERVGSNPFEVLTVDVASVQSAETAAAVLIEQGRPIDALLLNAGMVSGNEMQKSADGLELAFASSIIGHHVLTIRLLEAGLLSAGARVVLSGSEGARDDLPRMMGMKLYDFAKSSPVTFGDTLPDAMRNFAKGTKPDEFRGMDYYVTTKAFSSWWAASMARTHGDRLAVFTVSPGSNMNTNAGRHVTGVQGFLFKQVMPKIGGRLGMHMPTEQGAKRYVDVLLGRGGTFESGKSYMSPPKKIVGPLQEVIAPHLIDVERQDAAWKVLGELTGTASGE